MNRKQYLTTLFNKYQDNNELELSNFYTNNFANVKDAILIFPYILAGNYYYIPGFKKDLSSLSIFHFRMNEELKKKLTEYFNVRDIRPVSSSMNSDIISIYLYDNLASCNDLDFIVFYDSENISVEKLEYLKEKLFRIESWFKNRLKAKIEINLFSNKNRSIFKLKSEKLITIFDFYNNMIHLAGKYSYKFLLNKRITPLEFVESKKEILLHNWLNESSFFSLPHFNISKKELKTVIESYIKDILYIDFSSFHKLIYYHSLYNAKDISKYFSKDSNDKFVDELTLIREESGLDVNSIMELEMILLLEDNSLGELTKEKIKSKFSLFESIKILSKDDLDYDFNVLNANTSLMKFFNLFISIYKISENPINRLLKNNTSNIEFNNFLKYSFSSDRLIIMFMDNEWGLYTIKYDEGYQKFKKLFSKNSLIELLIFSIYNKYIQNIIPTIKNKSNNILDENNYFNRLKNKLIKYDISFSVDDYIQNIENRMDSIENIYIFLNFSIKNKTNKLKDYTYVSEQWDPLNYGYQKDSNISEIALIIKTTSQKVYYYEYSSDEAVILAIKDIFSSETYRFNENVRITINIFDVVLSASIIFRLKKLFKNSYETFSYKNSMLLTSYNGTIFLLKKEDNQINVIPYKNEESFFVMLKEETISMHYMIDEDVLELAHFSKVVELIKMGSVDIFFLASKDKNWIYVFDEENQFYFFKNISLNFLGSITELALNHKKISSDVSSVNLYNVEKKDINSYAITPISIDSFKKISSKYSEFKLIIEGSISGDQELLSYKISNKVFHYKEYKDKSFWKMIKFVKLSNLDKIKIVSLNTNYFYKGKRRYSFKYKLKVFEIIDKKIRSIKDNI